MLSHNPEREALYLAVDAGGTKTDYLLATDKHELARARGGCIKRMRVSAETAQEQLTAALETLESRSGRRLAEVRRTCVGAAGNTVPLVSDWIQTEFRARIGGHLLLLNDVEIALDAAFQGKSGTLVLAGTGSNVAGRDTGGALLNAGGWGPALADQGSAHRIGFCALRRAFLARDEGRSTTLLAAAARFWSVAAEDDLVALANRVPPPDFASFSEQVHRCAAEGDALAAEILSQQGAELGYLVRLVIRRIHAGSKERAGTPPRVAFAGSVMEKVPAVRRALLDEVRAEFPAVEELPGVVDPLQGALWRARQVPEVFASPEENG